MTSLLSLPSLPRLRHRRTSPFSGRLTPAAAAATRQWLRAGLLRGTLSPAQVSAALRGGEVAAGELASHAARSMLPRCAMRGKERSNPPSRVAVAETLRWLLRAGLIQPPELPALLRNTRHAASAICQCFAEAEARAMAEVTALCAEGVAPDHWITPRPLLDTTAEAPRAEGNVAGLWFLLQVECSPHVCLPFEATSFALVPPRLAKFNGASAVFGIDGPLTDSYRFNWAYDEAIDDFESQCPASATPEEREAVMQAVCSQLGCCFEVLSELIDLREKLTMRRPVHGPITQREAALLDGIDRLTAALPAQCGWTWECDLDDDLLYVVPSVLPSTGMLDMAEEELNESAANLGDICGRLAFPSAPTSGALDAFYREAFIHNAVLLHVARLADCHNAHLA